MKTKDKLARLMTVLGVALVPGAVLAFSIESVTVIPSNPVRFGSETALRIFINTPNRPATLYKPTETALVGNNVLINIYPHRGAEQALGFMLETVPLGPLALGVFEYEVRLNPSLLDDWKPQSVRGTFVVAPEVKIAQNGPHFVIRWPTAATNFVLQVASTLAEPSAWTLITNTPAVVGSEFVLTNRVANSSQFFRLVKY